MAIKLVFPTVTVAKSYLHKEIDFKKGMTAEYFATWHGIIDTDEFNVNQDNSQIIFYPKVNHSFTIPAGTPLCQIIPFKREEWVATYQLKDSKIWHENRSKHTSHHDMATMDEQGLSLIHI